MKHIIEGGKTQGLEKGLSKESRLVVYGKKKYILRVCADTTIADSYVRLYKKFEKYGFMPALLYRDTNALLFAYIKGRDCNERDSIKVAGSVGTICAIINRHKPRIAYNIDQKFFVNLDRLLKNGLIESSEKKNITALYFKLKRRTKPRVALDLNDLHPDNFRLYKGKIYFVDIEAIKERPLGYGVIKGFHRWFRSEESRKSFLRGYSKILSPAFLTEDYIRFLSLYFYVLTLGVKLHEQREINPHDLLKLKGMIRH